MTLPHGIPFPELIDDQIARQFCRLVDRGPGFGLAAAQLVTCSSRHFAIVEGRRLWLQQPPAELLPDLLEAAAHR